jgi:predicted outer membrane repeat protein
VKVAVFIVISLALSILRADRTTWYVHPDSTINSIQAALDSCTIDDIVVVAPATYFENLIWPNIQGIQLISESGPEVTFIDGDSLGSVMIIDNACDTTTVIRGFTIRNGAGIYGGGLYCSDSSSPLIENNLIRSNSASASGGGIYCVYGSSPLIRSNVIEANTSATRGGGISSNYGSSPRISNCRIVNNCGDQGGGICCGTYSKSTIDRNVIEHNIAYMGGGIWIHETCSLFVSFDTISGNYASHGGGIFCSGAGTLISNIVLTENYANGWGGGIFCEATGGLTIRNSRFVGNIDEGLYCLYASPNVYYCDFVDNTYAGIACSYGGNPTVHYCNITGHGCGIWNGESLIVDAEHNWWGHPTGPYHPDSNPGGQGDPVSDYVDFIPWCVDSFYVLEDTITYPNHMNELILLSVFRGSLRLPKGRNCRVFDITGRYVIPDNIKPGIYFVEVDGVVIQKVVKIR